MIFLKNNKKYSYYNIFYFCFSTRIIFNVMIELLRKNLENYFYKITYDLCTRIEKLPESGSNRVYFRLYGKNKTLIASYNPVKKENDAFINFTQTFKSLNLNVPLVYLYDQQTDIYLLEDLGDLNLFTHLNNIQNEEQFESKRLSIFKEALNYLIEFQILGYKHIDFRKAFPRHSFDKQSILWDLNYFKYYFLKFKHINFDEQKLENDFKSFARYLTSIESNYFMYRDFQSRNIMLKNNKMYFIDYQGGRKGPLQYDLASFLYSAKTNLPDAQRKELLEYYIELISKKVSAKELDVFEKYYYAIVLVRIMQTLGAYGYRGLFENKTYFIESIPLALLNLKNVLQMFKLPIKVPELIKVLNQCVKCD